MLSDRPAGGPRRLMVVAGEVSGDLHAARLVQALRARAPDVEVFGVGGDHLRAAGAETVFDIGELAVTGFTEVLRHLPRLRRLFQALQRLVDTRRPDAVLLVDYPGFNLRLAERLHARGVKTLYYVCPQVWAWHRARIPRLARCVDRLMAFFPFEAAIFEGTGLQVDVVGHPLVDDACAELERPAAPLPWPGSPRVALLPGSRRQEIERVLPSVYRGAASCCRPPTRTPRRGCGVR